MPTLITRREGESLEINGIPIVIARARDKSATLVIGGYDADGLLETIGDCIDRAREYRDELDAGGGGRRTAYRQRRNLTEGEPPD